jgi:hypothetical protein
VPVGSARVPCSPWFSSRTGSVRRSIPAVSDFLRAALQICGPRFRDRSRVHRFLLSTQRKDFVFLVALRLSVPKAGSAVLIFCVEIFSPASRFRPWSSCRPRLLILPSDLWFLFSPVHAPASVLSRLRRVLRFCFVWRELLSLENGGCRGSVVTTASFRICSGRALSGGLSALSFLCAGLVLRSTSFVFVPCVFRVCELVRQQKSPLAVNLSSVDS